MKTGSKYNANLGVKDIAKLIRIDLKAAFPAVKTSVTIQRYAGGQSLTVKVTDTEVQIYTAKWVKANYDASGKHLSNYNDAGETRWTSDALALIEGIQAIVDAYNMDDSDSMTDYSRVNFYSHVGFDWDLELAQIQAISTRLPKLV